MSGVPSFKLDASGIREVGQDIWVCDGWCNFLGAWIPCRMTLLGYDSPDEESEKNLVVVSPFPADEGLVRKISSLGTVRFVLAPNAMHHLWVTDFSKAFPTAKLVGSHALGNKRKDVKWDVLIRPGEDLPPEWPVEAVMKLLPGFGLDEIVVLHTPSKSLVCTDIAFNFPPPGAPDHIPFTWPINWYLKLSNAYRPCCLSNPQRLLISDAAALKDALASILQDWDWEQIVLAHGLIITSAAKEAMRTGTYDFVCKVFEQQQAGSRYHTPALILTAVVVAATVITVGAYMRRTK